MGLIEKRQLHNSTVGLYDPPVDGKTPLDGAGNPRTSRVPAVDAEAKLSLGYTHEPLPAPPPKRQPQAPLSEAQQPESGLPREATGAKK